MNLRKFLHPSWLSKGALEKSMAELAPKYMKGRLVDIGCGTKPYKDMLEPFVSEHVGVDHLETMHNKEYVDIFADAYHIPVSDESFDSILCTAVLEHLEKPHEVFAEMYRILLKGGHALLTVPFAWHLHEEPRDFYRYTKHALSYLSKSNGFEVVEMISSGGLLMSFATEISYCIYEITHIKLFKPIQVTVFNLILFVAWILSFMDPTKEVFPIGYVLVIKK